MSRHHVGILALQGSFVEHGAILRDLGVSFHWVRSPEDMQGITHLILPGGESTTQRLLLEQTGLTVALRERITQGSLHIFATCAGAILCHDFGMTTSFCRNAYGSQQDSFVVKLDSKEFPDLQGVFIRAPKVQKLSPTASVLASYKGDAVMIEEGMFWALTFHPEILGDSTLHKAFLRR